MRNWVELGIPFKWEMDLERDLEQLESVETYLLVKKRTPGIFSNSESWVQIVASNKIDTPVKLYCKNH